MNDSYTIDLHDSTGAADAAIVRKGLDAYNESHVGATGWRPLNIFVRDAGGNVVGGLLGGTYWGWLYVDTLWLSNEVRRHGYGSRLLGMAEAEAIERGCRYVHLDTMSFQALPFYERHGYTVWGALDDMPAGSGQQRFFLRKTLPQRD